MSGTVVPESKCKTNKCLQSNQCVMKTTKLLLTKLHQTSSNRGSATQTKRHLNRPRHHMQRHFPAAWVYRSYWTDLRSATGVTVSPRNVWREGVGGNLWPEAAATDWPCDCHHCDMTVTELQVKAHHSHCVAHPHLVFSDPSSSS